MDNGRVCAYILSAKVYKVSDNFIGYVRQNDIESIRYEELALKLTKKQGYITRNNTRLTHACVNRVLLKKDIIYSTFKPGKWYIWTWYIWGSCIWCIHFFVFIFSLQDY